MTRHLESNYQSQLKTRLAIEFPEAVILKIDPAASQVQGFPDLLLLFPDSFYAALEVKRSIDAPRQPNQERWVDRLYKMSFASFISPETENQVIGELVQAYYECTVSI